MRAKTWVALSLCAIASACGADDSTSPESAGTPASPAAVLTGGLTARETIERRQDDMKDLGRAFKRVRDELGGGSPDLGRVREATALVVTAATDLPSWFPDGSGPETGVKMRAFAEIWTTPTEFATASDRFRTAAEALRSAAEAGDASALGAAARDVGKSCGGCHKAFRGPKPKK